MFGHLHAIEPYFGWTLPCGQVLHPTCPRAGCMVFLGQIPQPVAPDCTPYLPGGQYQHKEARAIFINFPTGHTLQSSSAQPCENEPRWQSTQRPSCLSANRPAGQFRSRTFCMPGVTTIFISLHLARAKPTRELSASKITSLSIIKSGRLIVYGCQLP